MHVSGSHCATSSEIRRFSYAVVPLGKVPSTGRALTGSVVTAAGHHRRGDRPDELGRVLGDDRGQAVSAARGAGDGDGVEGGEGRVDGGLVAPDHLRSAPAVCPPDGLLDLGDGLVAGQHAGDGEEAGLQHGVRPARQPGVAGHAVGVDREDAQPLVHDLLLDRPRRWSQSWSGGCGALRSRVAPSRAHAEDVDLLEEAEVVAADEPRLADEVGRADRVRPEPQVGDRLPARLLRVVDEVRLRVHGRVGAEDLDGVLVRADGAVGPDPEEDGPQGLGVLDVEVGVVVQARPGHVVGDADGEAWPRRRGASSSARTPATIAGGELLRREAVAAADHPRHTATARRRVAPRRGARRRRGTAARRSSPAPWSGPAPRRARTRRRERAERARRSGTVGRAGPGRRRPAHRARRGARPSPAPSAPPDPMMTMTRSASG